MDVIRRGSARRDRVEVQVRIHPSARRRGDCRSGEGGGRTPSCLSQLAQIRHRSDSENSDRNDIGFAILSKPRVNRRNCFKAAPDIVDLAMYLSFFFVFGAVFSVVSTPPIVRVGDFF